MSELEEIPTDEVTADQVREANVVAAAEAMARSFGGPAARSRTLDREKLIAVTDIDGRVLGVIDTNSTDEYMHHLIDHGGVDYFHLGQARSYLNHPAGRAAPDVQKPETPLDAPQVSAAVSLVSLLDSDADPQRLIDTLRSRSDDDLFGGGIAPGALRETHEREGTPIHDEISGQMYRDEVARDAQERTSRHGRTDREPPKYPW